MVKLRKLSRRQKTVLLIFGIIVLFLIVLKGDLVQNTEKKEDEIPVANEELLILGTADSIGGLEKNQVYTDQGIYVCDLQIDWTPYLFRSVQAVTEENKILHINNLLQREVMLGNCLIIENTLI